MNHYIQGGFGDGDGGEDDEEGSERHREAAAPAAAREAPSLPPVYGGAPPLSPLPSWLLGSPLPWRWDPWRRQKRGFWWL
jgi:hypothetical protein